jgi:WD40 repeat protein
VVLNYVELEKSLASSVKLIFLTKQVFLENQFVNVLRFHPLQQQLFLAGGSKGTIKLWDLRTGKSVCEYSKALGQVMDLDFSPDGKRFVSTSDIAKCNASDKALVVWNFETQIALSNQVGLLFSSASCLKLNWVHYTISDWA